MSTGNLKRVGLAGWVGLPV